MKKHLSLILLALMLAVCLIACTGDTSAPGGDTTAPTETTLPEETEPAPPADIVLIADGAAPYTIIRGEYAPQAAIDAAVALRSAIGDATKVFPDMSTDWVKVGTERDHTTLEILIGPTGFSESADAIKDLSYGEYIITMVGSKLVINAPSEASLNTAITAFSETIAPLAKEGALSLPADIKIVGTALPVANALPIYQGGTLNAIYHAGNDNQLVVINETNPTEYKAYLDLLAASGYTLYTENEMANNLFATYINDKYVINAGYYVYEEAARIIAEPRTTLPALAEANKYTKVMEPTLAMLGLESSEFPGDYQNGMSFVFQLADGSYIIIDGGFNRDREGKQIYDYLYMNAPDKNNITVAAWILTHAHGDHTGGYYNFCKHYGSQVKVELVIGNFPSDESRYLLGTEGNGGPKVMSFADEYLKADFLKAHVGYQLHVRDAEIEFLYSLESYAPGVLSYFNTSSLVFTIKIAGQTFFFPGDASNAALTITSKMYGDYLKCDVLQTAHHGYGTGASAYKGVTDTYDLVAPEVVLWPVGAADYAGMSSRAYDSHLQNLPCVKEIIVAGSRDVKIALPYTAGTSGQDTIIK